MQARSAGRRVARDHVAAETHAMQAEALVQRVEAQHMLSELVLALDEPYRMTVLRRYFEGRTAEEIAAIDGDKASTVRWRLKRGMDDLRSQLDSEHGDRKAWIVVLQPLTGTFAPPAAGAVGGASTTAAVAAKGVAAMKIVKIGVVVGGIVGITVATAAYVSSSSEAVVSADSNAGAEVGIATSNADRSGVLANAPADEPSTRAGVEDRRAQLLGAITVARNKRLARERAELEAPVADDNQPSSKLKAPLGAGLRSGDDLGELDKEYIQQQMRDTVVPLLKECYDGARLDNEELGGQLNLEFAIVGEEEIGGLVETSTIEPGSSTIDDPVFLECVRESVYAMQLEAPPAGGGRVVVRYPLKFSPEPPATSGEESP
jgi:hypothetical protein